VTEDSKRIGRPATVGARMHFFFVEEAQRAMDNCSRMMDSSGPSETIRLALMHFERDLITEMRGLEIAVDDQRLHHTQDEIVTEGREKRKFHITLSLPCKDRMSVCMERSRMDSPSRVVMTAILRLQEYLQAAQRGSRVVVRQRDGSVICDYTPWILPKQIKRRKTAKDDEIDVEEMAAA